MRAGTRSILIALVVIVAGILIAKRGDIMPQRDASWMLRRAQEQATLHSYSATAQTSISCQGKMTVSDVKITHMQPDRCRIEYVSEPLKGVIIGDDGARAWRLDPGTGRLVVGSSASCADDAAKLHLLLENHRVSLAGMDRIAGRKAYALVVRPKDSSQIRKRLWIDTDSFVVLRQEDYDSYGEMQSSTRFTSIRFAESFPDKLFETPKGAKVTVTDRTLGGTMTLAKLSEAIGFAVRAPKYLPKGYMLDACRVYACPCECPHESACIRYTNGLSGISVFESKAGSGCRADAGCGQGPTKECAITKADGDEVARLERDGISFTVVADVDKRELKRIVDSL